MQPINYIAQSRFKLFKAQTFDLPTSHHPKNWYSVSGRNRTQKKKSIEGLFRWAKYCFYKGLDIQYHVLGYAMRMTPQKGGIMGHGGVLPAI